MEKGITTSRDNSTFAPNDTCTRARIVTFLYRAYKYALGKQHRAKKYRLKFEAVFFSRGGYENLIRASSPSPPFMAAVKTAESPKILPQSTTA